MEKYIYSAANELAEIFTGYSSGNAFPVISIWCEITQWLFISFKKRMKFFSFFNEINRKNSCLEPKLYMEFVDWLEI